MFAVRNSNPSSFLSPVIRLCTGIVPSHAAHNRHFINHSWVISAPLCPAKLLVLALSRIQFAITNDTEVVTAWTLKEFLMYDWTMQANIQPKGDSYKTETHVGTQQGSKGHAWGWWAAYTWKCFTYIVFWDIPCSFTSSHDDYFPGRPHGLFHWYKSSWKGDMIQCSSLQKSCWFESESLNYGFVTCFSSAFRWLLYQVLQLNHLP